MVVLPSLPPHCSGLETLPLTDHAQAFQDSGQISEVIVANPLRFVVANPLRSVVANPLRSVVVHPLLGAEAGRALPEDPGALDASPCQV